MLLLLTLACDRPLVLPTCEDVPSEATVGACFSPPEGDDTWEWAGVDDTIVGEIAEVGAGAWPEACAATVGQEPTATAWWARVTTESGDRWIGVDTPGAVAPAVGTAVTAYATYTFGDFGPTQAALAVHDASGALLGWAGEGATPESLTTPDGLTLATGAAVCHSHSDCGDSEGHDVDVTVGDASGTVPRGGSASVGGNRVTVGASIHQVEDQGGCLDWYVALAIVGMAPE